MLGASSHSTASHGILAQGKLAKGLHCCDSESLQLPSWRTWKSPSLVLTKSTVVRRGRSLGEANRVTTVALRRLTRGDGIFPSPSTARSILQPHLPQIRLSSHFKMHLLLMSCCGDLSEHQLSIMDTASLCLGLRVSLWLLFLALFSCCHAAYLFQPVVSRDVAFLLLRKHPNLSRESKDIQ